MKSRAGKWICSSCKREREPQYHTLPEITLIRTDARTGLRGPATLSSLRNDLADRDGASALLALVTGGRAATPQASYELEAGESC